MLDKTQLDYVWISDRNHPNCGQFVKIQKKLPDGKYEVMITKSAMIPMMSRYGEIKDLSQDQLDSSDDPKDLSDPNFFKGYDWNNKAQIERDVRDASVHRSFCRFLKKKFSQRTHDELWDEFLNEFEDDFHP